MRRRRTALRGPPATLPRTLGRSPSTTCGRASWWVGGCVGVGLMGCVCVRVGLGTWGFSFLGAWTPFLAFSYLYVCT